MMKLSVIIVNYNVKYFLEQAVQSALKASQQIAAEVIVVDNNSVDGSVDFIKHKFPGVVVIANKQNVGFSKANNQGIAIAKGEYVLLLNPDTVVQEDTFTKCIDFMDSHPDAGGLGVKMIDGKGNFLPESKRAFPSPAVAFYKAFGLASLFPKSKTFGKYHLGYLHEDAIHEVDVLAGAFMLMRKNVLEKTGSLDEDFFMYGEDIDMSYRIVKAGYKNYYFPETTIIHYKGESTKKGSLNYVKMFYQAMKIFAHKHFSGSREGLFIFLINIAIYARAFLSVIAGSLKKVAFPLLDMVIMFTGLFFIKYYWEYYVKYIEGGEYPPAYLYINVPIYIFIWVSSIYFSGGYDKNANIPRIIRGIFWGTIIIAAVYGFLPEQYRFSRGMIIAGAAYITFVCIAARLLIHFFRHRNFRFGEEPDKKIIIVGNHEEAGRAHQLLNQLQLGAQIIGHVHTSEENYHEIDLGNVGDLEQIAELYKAGEVIFCGKDISSSDIIHWIITLGSHIDYKIIPDQSLSIIGSNSKNTAGDLYTVDIQLKISYPQQRRSKRLFDIFFALFCLLTLPVTILVVKNKGGYVRNIFAVIFNRKSWVGYAGSQDPGLQNAQLPFIKKGALNPLDVIAINQFNEQTLNRVNFIYARDYRVTTDFEIVLKAFKKLGNH